MKEFWINLQTKGYHITNKRVVGNPSYTSEETRRKDLIQELALVVDFINNKTKLGLYISFIKGEWKFETPYYRSEISYQTNIKATIAAIEYLVENKLI